MRKLVTLLIVTFLWVGNSWGQVNTYTFTEGNESYTATGGTNSTATGDDGSQNTIAIGFDFVFDGLTYTTFSINTNGWIRLGATIGTGSYTNSLGVTAVHRPLIAPFWDDNNRGTGAITYLTSGTAPDRTLEVDWNQINIGGGGSTSSTMFASFKLRIYETTNVIEFIYGPTMDAAGTLTASVGINGASTFFSITPGSPSTFSTGTANNGISSTTDLLGKKFTLTPPVAGTPIPPSDPNPSNAALGVAVDGSLTWTFGANTATYDLMFGPAGSMTTVVSGGVAGATGSYSYSGLNNNDLYEWQVIEYNGALSTNGSVWSFRTVCLPIPNTSFPWVENFDAMPAVGLNILPDCWLATSATGTPWSSGNAASITYNDPCSSPNYVYVSWSPSGADKFLITPAFNLKGGTSYDFKFNWVGDNYNGWTADVWVNTVQSGTGATQIGPAFLEATTTSPQTCAQVIRSFVPAANGDYFFMIRVNNNYTPYYLGFDDFSLEQTPDCPTPHTLTAAPAGYQATLGWTSVGGLTWDIEWGATPYTFTGTANVTGVTNPYVLMGLSPTTEYTYKVMANCENSNYSGWSDALTFTTTVACPAPIAPTATGITTTSANLGWTETGAATLWDIEFGPGGFTPTGTPTNTGVTNPFPITGLTSATPYSFYVRADCGGGSTSDWSGPMNFSTLCEAFPAPFSEQFTTWPPLCWDLTGGTYSWMQYNVGAVQSAKANFWSQTAGNTDIMTTPVIDVTGLAFPVLKFDWSHLYSVDYPTDGMDVKVSDDNGATWTTIWSKTGTDFNSNDGAGNTAPGTFVSSGNIPLDSYGDLLQIRFVGNSGYGPDAFVDNVAVFEPLAHDVETFSIDLASMIAPGTVTPMATVKNSGTNTETFPVRMTIGAYESVMTVTDLAPGAILQVTFDPWNAAIGTYTVNVCTELATDLNTGNDCMSKGVTVKVPVKMYSYVAYDPTLSLPEGPAWFWDITPGTITSLAATTSAQFIGAGAWADGVWYGSEYYDAALLSGGGWWTIDPTTGAMTMVADFDKGFAGIAYDKTSGIMYGTEWTGTTNNLYTIVKETGVATLVGAFGGANLMINLAADGSGNLYALSISDANLYLIDPTVPSATLVGATGLTINYAQDMEFDYDNNTMYAAAYTTTGGLYTVNLGTGACTLIGSFQGGSEITGFAIPYSTVPENFNATGIVGNGQTQCFNATNTLTLGGASPFAVETGGSATCIAGVNILILPETTVAAGGYLIGYISNVYCGQSDAPFVAAPAGKEEPQAAITSHWFTLFPNPTNSNFTLVHKTDAPGATVKVEVYNMSGTRLLATQMIGEKQREFVTSGMPAGIYFVKVVADGYVETIKLIKTR